MQSVAREREAASHLSTSSASSLQAIYELLSSRVRVAATAKAATPDVEGSVNHLQMKAPKAIQRKLQKQGSDDTTSSGDDFLGIAITQGAKKRAAPQQDPGEDGPKPGKRRTNAPQDLTPQPLPIPEKFGKGRPSKELRGLKAIQDLSTAANDCTTYIHFLENSFDHNGGSGNATALTSFDPKLSEIQCCGPQGSLCMHASCKGSDTSLPFIPYCFFNF